MLLVVQRRNTFVCLNIQTGVKLQFEWRHHDVLGYVL